MDPLSVHGNLPADLFNQSPQIDGIIGTGIKKITTSIGSIPELGARSVGRAIGVAVEKTSERNCGRYCG